MCLQNSPVLRRGTETGSPCNKLQAAVVGAWPKMRKFPSAEGNSWSRPWPWAMYCQHGQQWGMSVVLKKTKKLSVVALYHSDLPFYIIISGNSSSEILVVFLSRRICKSNVSEMTYSPYYCSWSWDRNQYSTSFIPIAVIDSVTLPPLPTVLSGALWETDSEMCIGCLLKTATGNNACERWGKQTWADGWVELRCRYNWPQLILWKLQS